MKEYANIIQKHFTERRRIEKSAKKKLLLKGLLSISKHFFQGIRYLENFNHMGSNLIIGFLAAASTKTISSYVYFHTMK
jgi:hypothetical protein